jgi:cell pole-organizing protein PopZ
MSQPAKVQEPSMEEILASIRRIIADDEGRPPPKPASPTVAAAPPPRVATVPATPPPPQPVQQNVGQGDSDGMAAEPGDATQGQDPRDVLDLTEQMAVPEAVVEAPNFQTIDGQPDVVFTDAPPQQEPTHLQPEPVYSQPEPEPEPESEPEPEPELEQAQPEPPLNGALDHALLSSSTSAAVDSAFNALAHTVLVQNARTLEDLVREMLRPMLKSWLDDNLPSMVERIVKAEIERVSRGRG